MDITPEDKQPEEVSKTSVSGNFDDHKVGLGSPLNGGTPKGRTWDSDSLTTANDAYMKTQYDMYAMSNRAYDLSQDDKAAQTGVGAIRDFNNRMDDFQKAYESGQIEDGMEAWDQVRKDARNHALSDSMFYESYHSGAWADARSMTSDEHVMFLGQDWRARTQYIHDSSETSELAVILGLKNTDHGRERFNENGHDPTQEGDWTDTIMNLGSALFNYENIMEDVGERKDPEWTKDAQDNAWSAMNAGANGREIIKLTGMKREALAALPNGDSLIYVMNRKYKEMQFSQHASQDNLGGMSQTFGQMLPSIMADPDTVGELTLALIAAIPSAGGSVATWAALKAGGTGAKAAMRFANFSKHVNRIARFTPTRVIGDFIVPFAKATKDAKNVHGVQKRFDRMSYAWRNIEQYDDWKMFLMGAGGDGFVGGAGSFLLNAANIDSMNEQVYGKKQMPSVLTFDMLATRGLMGIGGAWALGGAIRKTMSMAGGMVAKNMDALYTQIHGMDKAEVHALTMEGMYEKTLAEAGVDVDPGVVTTVAASADQKATIVGASPLQVAVRVKDLLKGKKNASLDDVNTAVNTAIKDAAHSREAKAARLLRAQQQHDQPKSDSARERSDTEARNDMNDL